MKRKNIAICIDIGIIVLVFFIVFTIPVLFGSLSKKDEELSKVTQEKNEALSQRDSEIARLKALLAAKENN